MGKEDTGPAKGPKQTSRQQGARSINKALEAAGDPTGHLPATLVPPFLQNEQREPCFIGKETKAVRVSCQGHG